jgi:hypothetical protein
MNKYTQNVELAPRPVQKACVNCRTRKVGAQLFTKLIADTNFFGSYDVWEESAVIVAG